MDKIEANGTGTLFEPNGAVPIYSRYSPIERNRSVSVNDAYTPFSRRSNSLVTYRENQPQQGEITLLRWIRQGIDEAPAYRSDSRTRDAWLQEWRYKESHVAGMLYQTSLLYANRGWYMTGGRNQIRKFSARLHDMAKGKGWRYGIKQAALSFLSTDLNALFEVEREQDITVSPSGEISIAPMVRLNPIDPAKCRLINLMAPLPGTDGKWLSTLEYKNRYLFDWDYIRTPSFPTDREGWHGLGYCALSRALELIKLLYYVLKHDQEEMDSEMPDGLLILTNIQKHQWDNAMKLRKEDLTAKERKRYGGLEVLAGGGPFGAADAKLLALSQLPNNFNRQEFIDSTIYGICLCLGFDPAEFWVVNAGVLGRGQETKIQHEKTLAKGVEDFPLTLQEQIQRELPDLVHFEMEERDEHGDELAAKVDKAYAEIVREMSQTRSGGNATIVNPGEAALSVDEIRKLWALYGLIPEEWTAVEEDVTATDEILIRQKKSELLDSPSVRRACETFWDEPIIMHRWQYPYGNRELMLWESGDEALRKRSWQLNKYAYQGEYATIETEHLRSEIRRAKYGRY